MCNAAKCCFCCSLKTGVYIAMGYTSTYCVLGIAYVGWILNTIANPDVLANLDVVAGSGADYPDIYQASPDVNSFALGLMRVVCIVVTVIFVLWLVSALLMPIALMKKIRGYLVPWLIMTWIITVLIAIGTFDSIRKIIMGGIVVSNLIQLLVGIIVILANVACLCGVTPYYQNNLKERAELVQPAIQYAPQAQVVCPYGVTPYYQTNPKEQAELAQYDPQAEQPPPYDQVEYKNVV